MNSPKNSRWQKLLDTSSPSYSNSVVEEIKFIAHNQTPLLDILCNLPPENGFCKKEFFSLYSAVRESILDEWFLLPKEVDCFTQYNNLPVLSGLTVKARRKIWMDVPRTFMAFISGDESNEKYIELLRSPQQQAHMMAVLCSTLSASATYLDGRYTQAAAYHFIALRKHNLQALYVVENALTEYIEKFEAVLSSYCLPKKKESKNYYRNDMRGIYSHLKANDLNAQYFAVQWFASCFALNVSADTLIHLQEIFLYGSDRKSTKHLLIRLGVAILYRLGDDLVIQNDFESLYTFLKDNTKQLCPEDVIPLLFAIKVEESHSKNQVEIKNEVDNVDNRASVSDVTCTMSCSLS